MGRASVSKIIESRLDFEGECYPEREIRYEVYASGPPTPHHHHSSKQVDDKSKEDENQHPAQEPHFSLFEERPEQNSLTAKFGSFK